MALQLLFAEEDVPRRIFLERVNPLDYMYLSDHEVVETYREVSINQRVNLRSSWKYSRRHRGANYSGSCDTRSYQGKIL